MKKVKTIAMLLLVGFMLGGCAQKDKEERDKYLTQPVTAKEIMEPMIEKEISFKGRHEEFVYLDLLNPEETEFFFPMKYLDVEDIKEGYALQGKRVTQSSLLVVLEGKDKESVDRLEEAFNKVIAEQMEIWGDYIPDQYDMVKNNEIDREGNFLAYITSKHVDALKEIFENTVR